MYFLIEKEDGSPVVVAGPCWPFCVGVTVPLIVGISSAVIILIVLNPAAGLVRSLKHCLSLQQHHCYIDVSTHHDV
jgi:hypothetical protein